MADRVEHDGGRRVSGWRIVGWGIAALLLLLPLVAMQFTSEVMWTVEDFIFAGVLFGSVGIAFELTVRMTRNWRYRGGVAMTLAASFLIIWANAAVGMIGSEDNLYNFLFGGVILIALIGAVAADLRAAGMARVMVIAALAHVGVAAGGFGADPLGAQFSMVLATPWLLAAALFHNAARAPG